MSRGNIAILRPRSPAADPTLPVILEFQWPSTAIVNAPVPWSARGVVWVITSLVATMIGLMCVISVDQVVTANGILVSGAPTLVVQPLDTVIVRSIEVRDGEHVKAGQVLARLDPTQAAADLGALTAKVSSLAAEVARWQAEAQKQPFAPAGGDADLSLQAAIYMHRQAEFDLKLENYDHKIAELNAMISRAAADANGYKSRLGVAKDIEAMRNRLETLQVGSRLNTLVAADNRAEMARSMATAEQTGEGAKRDLAAMSAEREGYIQSWRADVSQKLADAKRLLSDAQEQLKKAKLHNEMVELRADQDAIVRSIAKVSPGAVMQSGQQFFTLVPDDSRLSVEANISGRENGFVKIEDPASIKFDTFPFAQYGMAKGIVQTLSPSSFSPQDESRNPTSAVPIAPSMIEPFYRAKISIDQLELRNLPPNFHLIPGMPVTVDIKVGQRTVMTYLLGRLLPIAQEGMREP